MQRFSTNQLLNNSCVWNNYLFYINEALPWHNYSCEKQKITLHKKILTMPLFIVSVSHYKSVTVYKICSEHRATKQPRLLCLHKTTYKIKWIIKKKKTECEESTKHSLFTQSTKHGVWYKRIVLLGSSFI